MLNDSEFDCLDMARAASTSSWSESPALAAAVEAAWSRRCSARASSAVRAPQVQGQVQCRLAVTSCEAMDVSVPSADVSLSPLESDRWEHTDRAPR